MKLLVVLSLLGLAAAKPQWPLPYGTNLLTPTFYHTPQNTQVANTYTATYPYAGVPFVQAANPTQYRFPITYSPIVSSGYPVQTTSAVVSRQKRSADPAPEADPAVLYTTGGIAPITTAGAPLNYRTVATIPSTSAINYQYSGFPAAVSTYTYPQQPQLTYSTFPNVAGGYSLTNPGYVAGVTPYSGLTPFTGISPYNAFPFFNQVPVVTSDTQKKN